MGLAALQEWRQQAVKVVLLVVVIVALPSYIFTILNEVRAGRSSLLLWLYLGVYLAIVGLAFLPRLDFKVKAWLFILVAYMNAAASLARLGLAGSGRVYLVAMPVIAALIISPEAGLISAAVSLGLYTAFALLAHYGVLQGWISLLENPLSHRVLNERQAITVRVNDPQADLEIRERMRRLHVQSLLSAGR